MNRERVLVCGLGSLGQHCVVALKEFGVSVIAIEQVPPQNWEIPNLLNLLDGLLVGDCRQNSLLEQAEIGQCRAALLVTTSEQVNVETALAIRQLNPGTRLVVRSGKENLNQLLSRQLGNFTAYEPTELPANAFALAALGTETLGFFNLEGQWLRVIQCRVSQDQPWCYTRRLHELNTRTRRLLAHAHQGAPLPQSFHQWEPEETVLPGDTLVYVETAESFSLHTSQPPATRWKRSGQPTEPRKVLAHFSRELSQQFHQFWQVSFQQQVRRVALICGLTVLLLLLIGTLLFHQSYPGLTFPSAFYATAILLLGGYGDLFGNLQESVPIPWWLQLFALGTTVFGTVFVGVLYAVLTEALLSSKFQLAKRRPPIPQQDHIIIIGLGRVGQRVATFLQQLKQSLVGVTLNPESNPTLLPDIPLVAADLADALAGANLSTAKSVVVVTDDEILNLEVALMVQGSNPDSHLVIRTSGQRLSQHLMAVLPKTQVLGMYAVAAEVFAGAAFGENIINLFRFNHQTILVTEYQIEAGDTLNGLLLAEVAFGYGIVPLLHQRSPNPPTRMPSDDIQLAVGDRLIVLAAIEGLQRVEVGNRHPQGWQVRVERAMTPEAIFEGANTISRISGCPLGVARELMNHLPGTLISPLYQHQGRRLVRALSKIQAIAHLLPTVELRPPPKKSPP
jgi:Trk K+ transport system NAD-binding subunit